MKRIIFVSSVQREFVNERATIYDLITSDELLSNYFQAFLFEYAPATPRKVEDLVKDAVASCDIFVVLLGSEYGAITGNGISISHQEYRWAKERDVPCLVFVKGSQREGREPHLEKWFDEIRKDGVTYRRFGDVLELKSQLYSTLVRFLQEQNLLVPSVEEEPKTGTTAKPKEKPKRIFLVHGRDEAALHKVARFVERLVGDIVVLSEMPSEGRTIIEKLEHYSDVGFAIVLLTGDDKGGLANLPSDQYAPRARQNVILELGYFVGLIGRKNVCALYTTDVEIPSDYHGVIYIELDDKDAWKLPLAREMKAAELPIDLNRAIP